jgi:L-alanine-DL-glutamate epimerase-like enolase superfamily enzyme
MAEGRAPGGSLQRSGLPALPDGASPPLCCAVPNSRWLEFIPQLDLVTRTSMKVENGYGVASEEPGLGIDWDWSALDKLVVHRKAHG